MKPNHDSAVRYTKISQPPLRAGFLPRPHLTAQLDRGLLAGHRMMLVAAPAGFGKTTLVSAWLHQAPVPAAWFSLDDRDNDIVRFLTYLIAAVQTVQPGFGTELAAGLRVPSPAVGDLVVDALINELAALGEPLVIVLDDFHAIVQETVLDTVATLVDYLPPAMRIVMTSRAEPALPLARWRARGQLVDVGPADLRFSSAETHAFLHQTLSLSLPPAIVDELARKTEGWAAGLQLAALSVQRSPDTLRAVAQFTGTDRLVADYLVSDVIVQQPADVQRFLMATAVIEPFNGALCDFVLETDGSVRRLAAVERGNLFLMPLDRESGWFRYHNLFGDALRARLRQTEGETTTRRLHQRASRWYATHGPTEDALRHAVAAADWPAAARLIANIPVTSLWELEGPATVRHWVAAIPDDALQAVPWAAMLAAIAALLAGDIHATRRYLALVEREPTLTGERDLIDAIFARNQGHLDVAAAKLARALRTLPSDSWLPRTMAQLQLAMVHLERGAPATAEAMLEQLQPTIPTKTTAGLSLRVQCAWMHAGVAAQRADLARAERVCRAALADVAATGKIVPLIGQLHATLATLAYRRNDLDAAESQLNQALHWGKRTGVTDILFPAYDTQIDLLCARGACDAAVESVQRLRALYERSGFPEIILAGRAKEALVQMRCGNVRDALAWAADCGLSLTDDIHPRRQPVYHALIDIHLTAARLNRDATLLPALVDLAQRLEAMAVAVDNTFARLSALLLQARAVWQQGEHATAARLVAQAYDLGETGGIIRLFVDSGPAVAAGVRAVAAERPGNAYAAALTRAVAAGAQPSAALPDPLTDREQEVLGLLAVGLSNREIAERLVVSNNTVRTHLKNLYSKLDVDSRTRAVHKARALGLLDDLTPPSHPGR